MEPKNSRAAVHAYVSQSSKVVTNPMQVMHIKEGTRLPWGTRTRASQADVQ